jgi:hypothetical protein
MDRSLRRHRTQAAKLRRQRKIYRMHGPVDFERAIYVRVWDARRAEWPCRWWQQVHFSPWSYARGSQWDRLMHTRPTRRHNDALLSAILRGRDAEACTDWWNYRKPHIYYW